MAATAGEPNRRQAPPFFSTITFNINRRADLAGLPAILRESRPDLVFLQEVNISLNNLKAAVTSLGYSVYMSANEQPKRVIAILSLHNNISVINVKPGFLQKATLNNLDFYHLHAPSSSSTQDKNEFFKLVADLVTQSSNNLPILIGDFNSVIDVKDVENQTSVAHVCHYLKKYIADNMYSDAYRVLHPTQLRYSWYRRGFTAARLDRVYLPPLLAAAPRLARYFPTSSDHHAFLLKMDLTGLGVLPMGSQGGGPAASSYWKFNSSLLREGDFMPAFQEMWRPVAASAGSYAAGPGEWWEKIAKPAIQDFCRRFSRLVAVRRAETRRFFTRALELALEAADWVTVDSCKERLQKMDQHLAEGAAVRTGHPVAAEEAPSIFHASMEGRSNGLAAIKTREGRILREPREVEEEVLAYFEALFQGRHAAAADRPEPFDSGRPFTPNLEKAAAFLQGLPALTLQQSQELEEPFRLEELVMAVEGAAAAKSPGLDGLSYELYKHILPLVGPQLLAALNEMLETGLLQPSLRQGVVRLLPKVGGVPMAAQLRPITLLNTDYKLLTKMLVNRFLPVLPDILQTTQLCTVKGRSIFDGSAAVLSAAAFLEQHRLPGYLLSLDFYHAYDRVCLKWVDMVMEAMGFGEVMRGWVAVLHKGATASFLLQGLSAEIQVLFSLRQGDPFAQLLFVIQEEPLLRCLEADLHGLRFGGLREATLAYIDDVAALGSKVEDLLVVDRVVADYEAASGAILNRNEKSVVLGLGSWAGRRDWPLQWLRAADSVKLYGVHVAPSFATTLQLSWEHTVRGLEATLFMWSSRILPYLAQRRNIMHTYAFSKLWYMAQVLPLPGDFRGRIQRAAGNFLWRGRLERLAWDELEAPKRRGGLGVANVEARALALLAKQACHRLAAGGRPRGHLSYWLGLRLLRQIPGLRAGLHAERAPPQYADLAATLRRVLDLEGVRPDRLEAVTAAGLYKSLVREGAAPKICLRLQAYPWPRIWGRLALPALPQPLFEAGFNFINNILPTEERRHRLRLAASPACTFCGAALDNLVHAFTACRRVAEAWECLLLRASRLLGPIRDLDLLFLKFPPRQAEIHVIYAIVAFIDLVWATRGGQAALSPLALKERLARAPEPFKSIFKL